MNLGVLIAMVLVCLSSISCGERAAGTEAVHVAREKPAQRLITKPAPRPTRCPGGLLCEAVEPLSGWRVPQACTERVVLRYYATCRLLRVDWGDIREFFGTRYDQVVDDAKGLHIVGPKAGPVDAAVAELRVVRHGHWVEVLALPRAVTSVVQRGSAGT